MSVFLKSTIAQPGWRRTNASLLAMGVFLSQTMPAIPAITNDATATGTYGGNPVNSLPSSASVPVTTAGPSLTVAKSATAAVDVNSDGVIGAGDTITYTYLITNNGNVTINNVVPVDGGPTFNTVPHVNALGAFQTSPAGAVTLAPTQARSFTAVYTLSALDAYRAAGITAAGGNAVENSATATGTPVSGSLAAVTPSAVETIIPANPKLQITKAIQTAPAGGTADAGETIVYRYTVVNTGNVAATAVKVNDVHEGAALISPDIPRNESLQAGAPFPGSSDATANDGTYSVLAPGATVIFTYTHTVLQAEVDNG
jgi:hypothetical protein